MKKDLSGQRFGRLVVIKEAEPYYPPNSNKRHRKWLCKCDCGNYCNAYQGGLLSGETKSCSCLRKENVGHTMNKHSIQHPLYKVLLSMRQRCSNPNASEYEHYGGRGIKVCDEWNKTPGGYDSFYEWAMSNGYKKGLTIDRINNDGNYEPSNCRWVTQKEQANNTSPNHYLTYNNRTLNIMQWSEETGINYATIIARIKYGWTTEEVLGIVPRKPKGKLICFNHENKTVKEWSIITGIPMSTIYGRLNKGWSIDEAIGIASDKRFSTRRRKNESNNN